MSDEPLLSTPRFRVERVERQRSENLVVCREVIRHPGSVVILPMIDKDHICLIRNYRVAVEQQLIELPAGTLEADEAPATCAARELTEETGYTAGRLKELTHFFAAPGILDEKMHLFVAEDLILGTPAREIGEEIENYIVTWDEALQMVSNGTICDAKTIIGLLFYRQHQSP